ncbi:MAG: DUF86 domain-containing protein [Firmicutes bacterium]|nr:DUF86 domain-containing protein [Bacillota bacterium]MCL5040498.1 DUF86 domain-containing protein [Bacillota bacterium]
MTVDLDKVRQKLQYIRSELRDLKEFGSIDEEAFLAHRHYPAAATRMLQVAIEAMLDLCAHITAREGWGLPKSYKEVVLLAAEHGLIPKELLENFLALARFRNRVVHLYDEVSDREVLQFIKQHLNDFSLFVTRVIERYLPG